MNRNQTRLKFANPISGLALIEGTAQLSQDTLVFEMAMTESISGAVDGVLTYKIPMNTIESVEFKKKWFRKSMIEFTSYDISTFKRIPCSQGFKYTIHPVAKRNHVKTFVYELLYKLTEIEAKRIDDRYKHLENKSSNNSNP